MSIFDVNVTCTGQRSAIESKRVRKLLPNDETPQAVPDQFIRSLRLAERIGAFDRTRPPLVGTEVEVTSGPFAGQVSKIAKARTEKRVDVLLHMFGSLRSVSAPISDLKEVE